MECPDSRQFHLVSGVICMTANELSSPCLDLGQSCLHRLDRFNYQLPYRRFLWKRCVTTQGSLVDLRRIDIVGRKDVRVCAADRVRYPRGEGTRPASNSAKVRERPQTNVMSRITCQISLPHSMEYSVASAVGMWCIESLQS